MPARSPILDVVAAPPHILYVPVRTFTAGASAVAVIEIATLSLPAGPVASIAQLGVLALAAIAWAYVAWRYLRDPHVESDWRVRLIDGRRWRWQRTRNLVPFPGNKYRA